MKISELKESDRLKALEYQKFYPISEVNDYDDINSFEWRLSDEGLDYWHNLNNAIFIDNDKKINIDPEDDRNDLLDAIIEIKNKPTHYQNKSNYDVIDFCNDYKLNFNRGSCIKYSARAGEKQYDGLTIKQSEIKDLKKAIDFLEREIKFLENE